MEIRLRNPEQFALLLSVCRNQLECCKIFKNKCDRYIANLKAMPSSLRIIEAEVAALDSEWTGILAETSRVYHELKTTWRDASSSYRQDVVLSPRKTPQLHNVGQYFHISGALNKFNTMFMVYLEEALGAISLLRRSVDLCRLHSTAAPSTKETHHHHHHRDEFSDLLATPSPSKSQQQRSTMETKQTKREAKVAQQCASANRFEREDVHQQSDSTTSPSPVNRSGDRGGDRGDRGGGDRLRRRGRSPVRKERAPAHQKTKKQQKSKKDQQEDDKYDPFWDVRPDPIETDFSSSDDSEQLRQMHPNWVEEDSTSSFQETEEDGEETRQWYTYSGQCDQSSSGDSDSDSDRSDLIPPQISAASAVVRSKTPTYLRQHPEMMPSESESQSETGYDGAGEGEERWRADECSERSSTVSDGALEREIAYLRELHDKQIRDAQRVLALQRQWAAMQASEKPKPREDVSLFSPNRARKARPNTARCNGCC